MSKYWFINMGYDLMNFAKDIFFPKKTENYGVRIPDIKESDYVSGWFTNIPYEVRCEDWTPYLPSQEIQFSTREDFQSCVSESYNSSIETQINWMIKTGKLSKEQVDEMKALNFFDDAGHPNFSDRYLAKMSNTGRSGNTQNAVAEAAKTYGLIGEKDWPETPDMTWNEFYATIPQEIKTKAKRIFDFINIGNKTDSKGNEVERKGGYEWVVADSNPTQNYQKINQSFLKELKHAPIQITIPICPSYHQRHDGQVITSCPLIQPAHALLLYKLKDTNGFLNRLIFDSYPPFNIVLENKYPCPYGLKIIATPIEVKVKHTITVDGGQISTYETPAFWARFISFLKAWGIKFVDKVGAVLGRK